jgi:AmmeMemoRadiSam system protein B
MEQDGRRYFVLTDPRRVSSQALVVAEHFGPFLALADGSRTLAQIAAAGSASNGARLPDAALDDLFKRLGDCFMLENDAYQAEMSRQLAAYLSADFRMPSLEGKAYSEHPDDLLDELESFAPGVPTADVKSTRDLKALITPHIDFARGGDTYAALWRRAVPDLDGVELAVIFGTDHNGAGPRLTLTRQSYATPWNILPTDTELVGKMARILKSDSAVEDHAFADEFNHTHEHSIELASVWLNWAVGDSAVKLLPVLCGSLGDYVQPDGPRRGESPASHTQIADAIGLLQQTARHRKTIFIAAADLAHVGPAFGDTQPCDDADRQEVEESDRSLLEAIVRGDHDRFLSQVREAEDSDRICGLGPVYMALWAAGESDGEWLGYQQCDADEQGGSFVSIAGALLYEKG